MECPGCIWDKEKYVENFRKHGVKFGDACCVFEDPYREEDEDDRDFAEDRWRVRGLVGDEVLVVIYTERNGMERLISARKATPREERAYYAQRP